MKCIFCNKKIATDSDGYWQATCTYCQRKGGTGRDGNVIEGSLNKRMCRKCYHKKLESHYKEAHYSIEIK